MEYFQILGYFGAFLVGLVLGLLGSGGSILSVPILVYLFGINPVTATAYSLFVVGTTSLIGSIKNIKNKPHEIASRSRGTPRIANSLLRRVRDFAQIQGDGKIDINITKSSLKALNVDVNGLDEMDNKILSTIIDKFSGGPVGLTTLSTAVSENPETIEEVYEPFLIQQGFIMRTPRGREATERAYKHLNKEFNSSQKGLF